MRFKIISGEDEPIEEFYLVAREQALCLRMKTRDGKTYTILSINEAGLRRNRGLPMSAFPLSPEGRIVLVDE